jgi:hypothetical protein
MSDAVAAPDTLDFAHCDGISLLVRVVLLTVPECPVAVQSVAAAYANMRFMYLYNTDCTLHSYRQRTM